MLRVLTVGFHDVGQPFARAFQLTVQDGGVPPLQTKPRHNARDAEVQNTMLRVKTLARAVKVYLEHVVECDLAAWT
jgi:hypothetical protein